MNAKVRFYACGVLSVILSSGAFAAQPRNKAEYCAQALQTSGSLRHDFFQNRAKDLSFRLGFQNQGGMMGGGTCWWHSEFTRNAIYLAVFRPDLRKPTPNEAFAIAKIIMKGSEIVEVPGFSTLAAFSAAFESTLQQVLEDAQAHDALFLGWINGLRGMDQVSPRNLQRRMDEVYELVETEHHIVYQMLQLPGVTSHAWLVVGMTRLLDSRRQSRGYQLSVIDSNYNDSTQVWTYENGATHLTYQGSPFVPHTQHEKQLRNLEKQIRKDCK